MRQRWIVYIRPGTASAACVKHSKALQQSTECISAGVIGPWQVQSQSSGLVVLFSVITVQQQHCGLKVSNLSPPSCRGPYSACRAKTLDEVAHSDCFREGVGRRRYSRPQFCESQQCIPCLWTARCSKFKEPVRLGAGLSGRSSEAVPETEESILSCSTALQPTAYAWRETRESPCTWLKFIRVWPAGRASIDLQRSGATGEMVIFILKDQCSRIHGACKHICLLSIL